LGRALPCFSYFAYHPLDYGRCPFRDIVGENHDVQNTYSLPWVACASPCSRTGLE
jgi:hypothetical protein